jgi:hypothetical protein
VSTKNPDRDPLAPFTRLGAAVERRWSAAGFDATAFPELARAELKRRRLHEGFRLSALALRLLSPAPLPETTVAFEEPVDAPVFPLHSSERVAVDLHLYGPSMTPIHDHDFDAAIMNLEGHGLLATFAFEDAAPVAEHVETGRLCLDRLLPMPRGAIELVHAGRRTIHRVTHLAARTAMVVVRSRPAHRVAVHEAQHVYFDAGLAIRVFGKKERGRPAAHDARAKMLGFLATQEPVAAHRFLMQLLRTGDAWSTASWLLDNWAYLAETGELEPLLRANRRRLGPWVDRLAAVQRSLHQLEQVSWTTLQGEDTRLLAALRLTLGDRSREKQWAAAHAPDLDLAKASRKLSRARQLTQ